MFADFTSKNNQFDYVLQIVSRIHSYLELEEIAEMSQFNPACGRKKIERSSFFYHVSPPSFTDFYFFDWQKYTENVELAALYKLFQGTKWIELLLQVYGALLNHWVKLFCRLLTDLYPMHGYVSVQVFWEADVKMELQELYGGKCRQGKQAGRAERVKQHLRLGCRSAICEEMEGERRVKRKTQTAVKL